MDITTTLDKLLLGCGIAGAALAAGGALATPAGSGILNVGSTVSGCTFTIDAAWTGFNGGNNTLELVMSQLIPPTNDGLFLEPTLFVRPVKGKLGTVSATLPPIAASTTTNSFVAVALLRDNKGAVLPGSTQFGNVLVAFCNGL